MQQSAQHFFPSWSGGQGGPPLTPKNLRVLVVDSQSSSRLSVCTMLRECHYVVTAVKTSKEAIGLLATHAGGADPPFDIILKEHEPPAANACRLLRKMARSELLATIPVVLMSSQDEREVVMKCLTLGAIDYLVKPLRHNELRHIWTRVWWWRRSGLGNNPLPIEHRPPSRAGSMCYEPSSSDSKEETKCDEEEEPTSKEGSAPDGNGNGHSNGNGHGSNGNGSNGSKEGNGTSRVEAKPHAGDGNGNGSSDNKNGNGNSATKNGHNGSNGNGASTTLAERNALVNTAEGKAPPNTEMQALPKVATGRSFAQYGGQNSRKRPATPSSQLAHGSEAALQAAGHHAHQQHDDAGSHPPASEPSAAQEQLQSAAAGGSGSVPRSSKMAAHRERDREMRERERSGVPQNVAAGVLINSSAATCTGTGVGGMVMLTSPGGAVMSSTGGMLLRNSGNAGSSGHTASEDTIHPAGHPRSGMPSIAAAGAAQRASLTQAGTGTGSYLLTGTSNAGVAGSATGSAGGPGSGLEFPKSASTPNAGALPASAHPHFAAALQQAAAAAAANGLQQVALPTAWSQQAVAAAAQQMQAALQTGQVAHAAAALQGYPNVFAGGTCIPPQMLPQLHPLQALYAAGSGSIGSSAPQSGMPQEASGMATAGGYYTHIAHQEQLVAAEAAAAAAAAGSASLLNRGASAASSAAAQHMHHHHHHHHQQQQQQQQQQAAAAAAAAAAAGLQATGGYNPILLLQAYMSQANQPLQQLPPQLQQLQAAAAWQRPQGSTPTQALPQQVSAHFQQASGYPGMTGEAGPEVNSLRPHGMGSGTMTLAPASMGAVPAGMQAQGLPHDRPSQAAVIMDDRGEGAHRLSTLPEPRRRRALALDKYRKKRKNLKFSKTIRYESRKQLAQQRPRVRGQFVKHISTQAVKSSKGEGAAEGEEEEEEEEEEDYEADGGYDEDGEEDALDEEEDEDEEGGGQPPSPSGKAPRRRGSTLAAAGHPGAGADVDMEDAPHNTAPPSSHKAATPRLGSAPGHGHGHGGEPAAATGGRGMAGRARQTPTAAATAALAQQLGSIAKREEAMQKGIEEEGLAEEEDDVVNSLRELRDGPPRTFGAGNRRNSADSGPDCDHGNSGAAAGGVGGAGATSQGGQGGQASLGSQSGQNLSRGSHGRASHSRSQQKAAAPAQEGRGCTSEQGAGGGRGGAAGRTSAAAQQHTEAPNNGHGKNGSDSGSNSPDENGGNGGGHVAGSAGDKMLGHGHNARHDKR
eukprot:CAMPEP_0202894608 /NCGR_PEP_ID=MMETSP1392-20130828/3977_1 /ASSEMBLY_ACC=CAM_ASM_000868 /TAXON_ID=225041 /ORGANISM="Chlamydomonas chlamydogama, Strain SAG 11-48b" /LENGTH=1255 /DNA_ID=CAMNT_0049579353 /DNA_START=133 /DNA_END=3900 /DNA_ORIENTATION=+